MDDCIDVVRGNEKKQELRVKYNIKDVIDMRKVMWRELDYYTLPVAIVRMLEDFIKETKPFCIKCCAKHKGKFDLTKRADNKLECNNCGHTWRTK